MSEAPGHSLSKQALRRPCVIENHGRAHPRISGSFLFGVPSGSHRNQNPLLATRFLGNNLSLAKTKFSEQRRRALSAVPRAILAADPASEEQLSGKFNLDSDSELQIAVRSPGPGSLVRIEIQITNISGSLILHWGAIRQRGRYWFLPSRRPDGTKVYKNRALRTPFVKAGSDSSLTIEIDDPEIQSLEFLVFDEAQNRWFKNNGQNFQVQLSGKGYGKQNASVSGNPNVDLPEDLVQIQAYLRWERKGRQTYTPDQEQEEYEAARAELLEEISRGTSVKELWAKLTNKPDAEEDSMKRSPSTEGEIPTDLVQVQAYIRWEKAGKPNYPPEKQLVMLYTTYSLTIS
ncbi:putative Alpha-glucan water dikinase, chloroplastic [Cocos nucifera]|uniref:Putative Alpha-glucan water dikinase, chloroplastic n=1 Tax=Cocos nucifera TaxID=13894 RepID=A0A8K0NAE7_COCNU|nr:putative Alpha-glucan water dikinase, chloroplastic [Cocos nucifera]